MRLYMFEFSIIILSYFVCDCYKILKGFGFDLPFNQYSYQTSDIIFNDEFVFFVLDLYPNQHVYINLDISYRSSGNIIKPNSDEYYIDIPNPLSALYSETRPTGKMKDNPSIKIMRDDKTYYLYYDGLIRPTKVVEMYLDLYNLNQNRIIGVIQINIIPDNEYIDEEEIIELGNPKYSKFKNWTYVKEVRNGTKTSVFCKNITDTGKPISFKKITNPYTKVMYDILDNSSLIDKNKEGGIEIDLTGNKFYPKNKRIKVNCNDSVFDEIELYEFTIERIIGYNRFLMENKYVYDKVGDSIRFRFEGFYLNDLHSNYLYPADCLNEFIDPVGNIVNTKEYISGSKITNITESIRILDVSKINSYGIKTLGCKVKGFKDSPNMLVRTRSTCDLNNIDTQDKNKISCTIFVYQQEKSAIFFNDDIKLKIVELGKDDRKYNLYDLENEEKITLESKFIYIPEDKGEFIKMEISGNTALLNQANQIKINPVYLLLEDKEKVLKNIIRIYLHNDEAQVENKGNSSLISYKKEINYSYIVNIPFTSNKIIIKCSDFFEDKKIINPKLFPNGKNTVYRNINNTNKHYSEFEKVQFEELFGTKGITILKKPETNNDLEIIIDNDYEIISEHIRPIYFICSSESTIEEWNEDPGKYIVIAIDPLYKNIKYQGCGINNDLFDKVNENCEYDLNKDKNVGIHCPDYVPEHFLTDNQEQYKSNVNELTKENPFKKLIRCYNRSTFFSRLFKSKGEIEILEKRNSVSELRSLWKIDKIIMKTQDITSALCVCYNKKGEPKSRIKFNM